MAKLSFVLDLVECILELAEIRGSGCNPLAESVSAKQVSHDLCWIFSNLLHFTIFCSSNSYNL